MGMDLFTQDDFSSESCIDLEIEGGDIKLYPNFFSRFEADAYFVSIKDKVNWKQENIRLYGKQHKLPRLMAWYGEGHHQYEFSGLKKTAIQWTKELIDIKKRVEPFARTSFNSVLLNLYRDGKDGVAWHSDDESELGRAPIIASISLGEEREFQLQNRKNKADRHTIVLPHGSLLVMAGDTQKNWLHQIPKRAKAMDARINLTYRTITS